MIAIVGNGNVATHLQKAFGGKTEVAMVKPRTFEGMPSDPRIILLCVADDAIPEVAGKIKDTGALVAHTSGSVDMNVLAKKFQNVGVLYPLQTFSKNMDINYSEIPVFIEGSSSQNEERLYKLANLFTSKINYADSLSRRKLHLASVFACNFTNALAGISEDILKEAGIRFETLIPLLRQTVDKLEKLPPKKAQTGPAVRKDRKVIEAHLKLLEQKPLLFQIYSNITQLIQDA